MIPSIYPSQKIKEALPKIDWEQVEILLKTKEKLLSTPQGKTLIDIFENLSEENFERNAKKLIPWKKGPFEYFGTKIDAEWRSDLKWQRMQEKLPFLENKKVLDIGCNNGHFMFAMAEKSPAFILGIDPVLPFWGQFQFINHFAKIDNIEHLMLGIEHLPLMPVCFDVIFSMGILYHHRNPLQQLIDIRESLVPGGDLILETIGIPGDDNTSLTPTDRYARMGNTWFFPTLPCLLTWLKRAKFIEIEVISTEWGKELEQRTTEWNPGPSYLDSIDSNDSTKTIEGYPTPERFIVRAKKKG